MFQKVLVAYDGSEGSRPSASPDSPGGAGYDARVNLLELRGFAFDLDGCVWAGPRLLPGARALIEALREAGRSVVFVTNSSRERAGTLAGRLTALGIPTPAQAVLSAVELTGEAIRRRLGLVRVLTLGNAELAAVVEEAGHTPLAAGEWARAEAVAIGMDRAFDFGRLSSAARAVAAGAAFFAVNLDPRLPLESGDFEPGCGALAEAIATAAGVRPVVVGKPHRPIFEMALERLACRAEQAAMVGDSLDADIAGGRAAGMLTVWLTGPARATASGAESADSGEGRSVPDLRVQSLEELHARWVGSAAPRPAKDARPIRALRE